MVLFSLLSFLALAGSFFAIQAVSLQVENAQIATNIDLPYPLASMQFNHTVNGFELSFTGTIKQILGQLAARYPSFIISQIDSAQGITAVPQFSLDTTYCIPVPGQSWSPVRLRTVSQSIKELFLISTIITTCNINARTFSKLSCENKAAIVLCNDNYHPIGPSCSYLVPYAQDISDRCRTWDFGWRDWVAGGQEFDMDDYNVIVSGWERRVIADWACGKKGDWGLWNNSRNIANDANSNMDYASRSGQSCPQIEYA
ncbi:hypothetical protein DL98DRAFT_592964 [Cadophora sp. DSE1049]|nr:hypothetical protein DL98DRAFT_592964 [Cadophora sp. DSE1049]